MSDFQNIYQNSQPLYPACLTALAHTHSTKKFTKRDVYHHEMPLTVEDGQASYWMNEKDTEKIALAMVPLLKTQSGIAQTIRRVFYSDLKKIQAYFPSRFESSSRNLTNTQIVRLLQRLHPLYTHAMTAIDVLQYSVELKGIEVLGTELKEHLLSIDSSISISKQQDVVASLSSFSPISNTLKYEREMLKMSLLPKKRLDKKLQSHHSRYKTLLFDYFGSLISLDEMQHELEILQKKSVASRRKELATIDSSAQDHQVAVDSLEKQYKIPADLRRAFRTIRQLGYLYTETKKWHMNAINYKISLLVAELSRRLEVPQLDLHYLTPDELILAAEKSVVPKNLSNRKVKATYFFQDGKASFLQGTKEEKLFDRLQQREESSARLKGTPASSGVSQGVVRVIESASHIHRIQEGDVLVTPMTTVDFVPAMKRASAVVTDLGGITSHAAIVSRELGIPCIVGTGSATKSLSTGQMVTVNANHGFVTLEDA